MRLAFVPRMTTLVWRPYLQASQRRFFMFLRKFMKLTKRLNRLVKLVIGVAGFELRPPRPGRSSPHPARMFFGRYG